MAMARELRGQLHHPKSWSLGSKRMLLARMDAGLVRRTQIGLINLAIASHARKVVNWVWVQLDAFESGIETLGEGLIEMRKRQFTTKHYRGDFGGPLEQPERYDAAYPRIDLIRFLAELRSESVEARIWRYLEE
ncbi:hypothetical protein BJ508DRAFT_376447 [Ascobolus immersus RN42]|uniref:Uncharacterized protein n=1 Tax=Ascobolus immersus RN42 TaxID=1160509 RepID=A0A3N4I5I5_ASCIM|nr:hypothetical protein BJ508DRAFT_376447 [Ascobolus immersus RN42]